MDMDRAREIVHTEMEKHRTLAKYADDLDIPVFKNDHSEIADALELLLEVTE